MSNYPKYKIVHLKEQNKWVALKKELWLCDWRAISRDFPENLYSHEYFISLYCLVDCKDMAEYVLEEHKKAMAINRELSKALKG